ncbi:hypothetical protein J1N35_018861 [Gossypium stocksii]|uniref:Uncharacterized protein n=1 Tax=Gossypium stocksii TaxID=47602 RepID=A0A9D3VPU3_9ROSI|nr:hypothetical protein J1N35_018861 [Gossypium stocksii]
MVPKRWPKGSFVFDANGALTLRWEYDGYYWRQEYESPYESHGYVYGVDSYN